MQIFFKKALSITVLFNQLNYNGERYFRAGLIQVVKQLDSKASPVYYLSDLTFFNLLVSSVYEIFFSK